MRGHRYLQGQIQNYELIFLGRDWDNERELVVPFESHTKKEGLLGNDEFPWFSFSLNYIMSSNFCYINPKNGLAKDQKVQNLVVKIIQKVSDIPNIADYKHNLELLTLVCCMIEHGIDNKKQKVKIDKSDIVFQVYNRLFNNMSPTDIKGLTSNITYLHENGRIKKRGLWTVVSSSICDWVTRRIL